MTHRLLPLLALLTFGCAEDAPETDAEAIGRRAKVWICHATSSETNPYNLIHVSSSAWDGEGRNDHTLHEGDYLASGPDEICAADTGDDGGGDDGGGTGGDDGGGDDGGDTGGEPPQCFDFTNEADCTAELTCTWDGSVCLPAGIEI